MQVIVYSSIISSFKWLVSYKTNLIDFLTCLPLWDRYGAGDLDSTLSASVVKSVAGAHQHTDDFLGHQVDILSALVQMVIGCYTVWGIWLHTFMWLKGSLGDISDVCERTLMYLRATLFYLILRSPVSTVYDCRARNCDQYSCICDWIFPIRD